MYLNCHTYYSYKYGTLSPDALLGMARNWGLEQLAHTDINSTSATLEMLRLSARFGVRVVPGIDFRNGAKQLFVALAMNNEGYREICAYLSGFLTTDKPPIPARAPAFTHTYVVYPLGAYTGFELLENEYIGVKPADLPKYRLGKIPQMARAKGVALHTASFGNKAGHNAHRLLRAIDNNLLLSKLPKSEEAMPTDLLLPPANLLDTYADFPHLIDHANRLLSQCSVSFEFGNTDQHRNQKTYTGTVRGDLERLDQLCTDGLGYRYRGNLNESIRARVDMETDIITKKGFLSYFLINHDITSYARSKGYFYVGRGSGANSLLAYLLRITDVDPIELDLYFERFINLYRRNPPDFDIDFSWTDRDDVTRYIFQRFAHTSLVGAYVTFQHKMVVRELGKVFGLPKAEIDALGEGRLTKGGADHMAALVLRYGALISGFPSHCSVHSSGIIIADDPLHCFGTTFLPPKGFPTSDFDMVIAEDVGLYKFDILAQRGLGKIRDTVDIVLNNQGILIDVHDIKAFKEDSGINENLREGRAMGCFYVESPAMRGLLCKLKVDTYLGLVAASSIIRPGVSQSGMMREYIKRFREPERRKDAHPVLLEIMPETFGVMVYQEDVIKVAHFFAGLDLAQADVLRRGMSGKFRSREEFDAVKDTFFSNCAAKGHTHDMTSDVWRQIESFAGYAFAKGHSASYAVESYQSLFLKTYYPLEYMVATVNNGGGFYRPADYLHEARMNGGRVHPPCVNHSEALCTIIGKDIYIGMGFLQGLESEVATGIAQERAMKGAFASFDNFVDRVQISLEQLTILIRIDAFRFTGRHKRELLWEAHFKLSRHKAQPRQALMFQPPHKKFVIPELERSWREDAFDQLELLGFSLCHPFDLLSEHKERHLLARHLPALLGKQVRIWGYLINTKPTRTIKGEPMNFGCFLDKEGRFFDTTSFPAVAAKYPYRGRGVYEIEGTVAEEFGFYSIDVASVRRVPVIPDPRYG
jgi:DNA polymerase-3 subunit alpha